MTRAGLPSQYPPDLLDIAAAAERRWRATPAPDELAECRSAEGSWGCKWGCKDQRASLSGDFTCLFNQRPRQEASPHNSAVPMATPLIIVAHPLPDSFQPRGEVETFECWRRERSVCVCVSFYLLEENHQRPDLVDFFEKLLLNLNLSVPSVNRSLRTDKIIYVIYQTYSAFSLQYRLFFHYCKVTMFGFWTLAPKNKHLKYCHTIFPKGQLLRNSVQQPVIPKKAAWSHSQHVGYSNLDLLLVNCKNILSNMSFHKNKINAP